MLTEWNLTREVLFASGICLYIVLLMVVAQVWHQTLHPPIENTRKLVHLGSGLATVSFSWIFHSHWTVLALGILFAGLMITTRQLGILPAVHAVERSSHGDKLFPLAVYLTFLICWNLEKPLYYSIAIGILSLSDTMAALVGKNYGNNFYEVENDRKSMEGSFFFFISTFLIIHLSLLLATDIERIHSVLIAFWIASMVTVFEAVSTHGTDNFFIPIGTTYLLWKIVPKPLPVILADIASLYFFLLLAILLLTPKRKLDLTGMLGLGLLLNASFRLLTWNWGLAVLCSLLVFNYSRWFQLETCPRLYQIRSVFYSVGSILIWVLVTNLLPGSEKSWVIVPFVGNVAAILGIVWDQAAARYHKVRFTLRRLGRMGWQSTQLFVIFYTPQIYFYPHLLQLQWVIAFYLLVLVSMAAFAKIRWHFFSQVQLLGLIRLTFAITTLLSWFLLGIVRSLSAGSL